MTIQVAELFISLGLKGADKTVGAMSDVKKGLGDIGSTSLEVKAGILAAMYGLERMMAISGAAGTGFQNFAALTGLSIQKLQEWQNAARQAGISSDEMAGSLKGVQNTMTNVLLGKGAPDLFARVAQAAGGIDQSKFKDTFYMMEKLQKAMQNLSVEEGNVAGKSFGLSEGTIAAMRRNMFTPKNFKVGGTYSDGEAKSLDKSNIAWANLEKKLQMAFGHFNAKHGQEIVNDISKITDSVVRLTESLFKLGESLKVFELLDTVVKGWDLLLSGDEKKGGLASIAGSIDNNGSEMNKPLKDTAFGKMLGKVMPDFLWKLPGGVENVGGKLVAPKHIAPEVGSRQPQSINNSTTVHQKIEHHGDAKDTGAVKDTHRHAVKTAYNQRAAQRQGP